jgi:hypothetical protein
VTDDAIPAPDPTPPEPEPTRDVEDAHADAGADDREEPPVAQGESLPSPPPREAALASFRAIDADHVVATLERLETRIEERFPGRGLGAVCRDLVAVAQRARERAEEFGRPIVALRVISAALVFAIVAASAGVFLAARLPAQQLDAAELIQILEAGINDVVLIGAAIFFLTTLERRIKRGRALRAIHEIRSVAHIIDMHQLTKDPERVLNRAPLDSSPKERLSAFELNRYLDYCSEMLSLTGKIAALYVQRFEDEVALAAVNEVEHLCTGLSRKIWQKIMIVESLAGSAARPVQSRP